MFFRKTAKKSLFLMAFLLFAATLFAQDFSWDPDVGFVVISSEPEETSEVLDEPQEVEQIETIVSEPADDPVDVPADEPIVQPADEPYQQSEEETIDETDQEPVIPPVEETIEDAEPAPTDFPIEESQEDEAVETEPEKHEYEALALIRYKNTETISFKLKVSYIPKPYILGISFAAGFTEYKLIQPFYFGGFLEPHVGIPQKAFPYKYELGGTALKGPLIVGGKLYAPFGICVFPFQENIEFFVEFAPGISLNMMWDAKFGKDSITSKLYPAFYGSLRTGATYKGFTFFIEGNYDAILGFGVSAGIGYSINFNLSSTPDYAPSLE